MTYLSKSAAGTMRAALLFVILCALAIASPAYAATITWTAQTAAEENSWQSVVYGEGIFVAVSSNGTNRIMTSPDGTTWTARSAPDGTTDSTWKSVTYGNGTFVAVANGGTTKVMTSPDGVTWSAQTAAEENSWESVTYGNGTFVAVADTGTNRVMSSPDGVTWTPHLVTARAWRAITYGNSTFVAVNDRETAMTSADGVTWSEHEMARQYSWRALTYGNGLFVAGAGNEAIQTSPDGSSWTQRSYPSGFPGIHGIVYGGDTFVAVAGQDPGKVALSSDGITWTTQDTVSGSGWLAITYANNTFVAVGEDAARVITGATVPTVSTQAASSVSATSVTGNGTIVSEGTASSTVRGFVYGVDAAYGATTTEAGAFGSGSFSATIESLTCNTTYHYASYATNDFGTGYGADTTFTTSACSDPESDPEPDSEHVSGNGMIYTGDASTLPGYLSPRMQLIHPDGTVEYLDASEGAAAANNDTLLALLRNLITVLTAQLQLLMTS